MEPTSMMNYRSTKCFPMYQSQNWPLYTITSSYSKLLSSAMAKLLAPDFAKPNLSTTKITKITEMFTLVLRRIGKHNYIIGRPTFNLSL